MHISLKRFFVTVITKGETRWSQCLSMFVLKGKHFWLPHMQHVSSLHSCPPHDLSPKLLILPAPPMYFLFFLWGVLLKWHNASGWKNIDIYNWEALAAPLFVIAALLCQAEIRELTHTHTPHTLSSLTYLGFPAKCNPVMWESLCKIFRRETPCVWASDFRQCAQVWARCWSCNHTPSRGGN